MSGAVGTGGAGGRPEQPASPRVSVIVVNWNTREVLLECLDALRRVAGDIPLDTIVVDNGSLDGSAEAVSERHPRVQLISNRRNAGFARANNQALPRCRAPYVLFLNPDTVLNAGALEGLLAFMEGREDVGAAGLQLRFPDGRLQNSHDNYPSYLAEILSKHLLRILFPRRYPSKRHIPDRPVPVEVVIGACLLVRTDLMRRLGGFDEGYFLFVEEADLCKRIRDAGNEVYHLPHLTIIHGFHHSQAQAPELAAIESARSTYRFFRKHRSRLGATLFCHLVTAKLLLVNLPLSLIATVFTAGRTPRHVRRLRMRATLLAWHLLGCPRSWGMRLVSPFRGYQRQWTRRGLCRRQRILACEAGPALRRLIEDPLRSLASAGWCGEVIRKQGPTSVHRVVLDEPPPPGLSLAGEGPGRGEPPMVSRLVLVLHRCRGIYRRPGEWLLPSPGIEEFERSVGEVDSGFRGLVPLGAGCDTVLGLENCSFSVFLVPGEAASPLTLVDNVLAAGGSRESAGPIIEGERDEPRREAPSPARGGEPAA